MGWLVFEGLPPRAAIVMSSGLAVVSGTLALWAVALRAPPVAVAALALVTVALAAASGWTAVEARRDRAARADRA